LKLDAYDAVATKLDIREFAKRRVDNEIKKKVLEAARLTGSSMNSQHWRFILVQDSKGLDTLARDSTTGKWVKGSDFAVVVCVDPKIPGSGIDAGRSLQDMEVVAWEHGVGSGIYTGFRASEMRSDFRIPENLSPAVVVGFGYPQKKLHGRKKRKPLSDVAFLERFGNPIDKL
jgi:nitroreductase